MQQSLTPREEEIMLELLTGKSTPVIAYELGISESTINTHMPRIFEKLRVSNRAMAIAAYFRYVGGERLASLKDEVQYSEKHQISQVPMDLELAKLVLKMLEELKR